MKSVFYMPRKDRLAYLWMIGVILLGSMILSSYDRYRLSDYHAAILKVKEEKGSMDKNKATPNKKSSTVIPTKAFNPNQLTSEELQVYGFSTYSANNLVKYREKGGRINEAAQLYSIYGIDSAHIKSIIHLVQLPKSVKNSKPRTYVQKPRKSDKSKMVKPPSKKQEWIMTEFDPNVADSLQLQKLGFSKYAIKNLLRYRSKGGRIKTDSGLARIYGVDSATLHRVLPYITIANEVSEPQMNSTDTKEDERLAEKGADNRVLDTMQSKKSLRLNINDATAEELIELHGIGPFLSEEIVKYRNQLGGYHKLEQLLEIHRFDEETLSALRHQLYVSGDVKKFYIPATEFKKVLSHPYMTYETTKMMKACKIKDCDDQLQMMIRDSLIDHRVIPYLITENIFLQNKTN